MDRLSADLRAVSFWPGRMCVRLTPWGRSLCFGYSSSGANGTVIKCRIDYRLSPEFPTPCPFGSCKSSVFVAPCQLLPSGYSFVTREVAPSPSLHILLAGYEEGLHAATKDFLKKPLRACIRFLCGLGRYGSDADSIPVILSCVLLHKTAIRVEAKYLFNRLNPNLNSNSSKFNFVVSGVSRDVMSRSFFVGGVMTYNSLPMPVAAKRTLSWTGSKSACKNFFSA